MTEPSADWLLVLGSNLDDAEARLDAALAALAGLGRIERRSARREGDDIEGRGPRYLNQLVLLRSELSQDDLRAGLKQIEGAQGRDPAARQNGRCALDIDLLARIDDGRASAWLADKPLRIPAVAALLRDWGWASGSTQL